MSYGFRSGLNASHMSNQTEHMWYNETVWMNIFIAVKKKRYKTIKSYLQTPPLGQDMTQGQFLSGVY